MKSNFENLTKLSSVFFWLALLLNSSCKSTHEIHSGHLKVIQRFPGTSIESRPQNAILADILYTSNGRLATLERDTGRIAIFQNGKEKNSFVFHAPSKKKPEATAFFEKKGTFSVMDVRGAVLTRWSEQGQLVAQDSIVPPLNSNQVSFAANGDFYSSAEGVRDKNFILHYDKNGRLLDTLATNTPTKIPSASTGSIAKQLARGLIPDALQDSILLATQGEKVFVLHRSKPLLQCYVEGKLAFEKELHFPELPKIHEAVQIRNRLLTVENHYIALSYWNDFTLGEDGSLYVLLALQNKPVIYKLQQDGEIIGRFTGVTGKGHLLAVSKREIAIADALSGLITLYAI